MHKAIMESTIYDTATGSTMCLTWFLLFAQRQDHFHQCSFRHCLHFHYCHSLCMCSKPLHVYMYVIDAIKTVAFVHITWSVGCVCMMRLIFSVHACCSALSNVYSILSGRVGELVIWTLQCLSYKCWSKGKYKYKIVLFYGPKNNIAHCTHCG